MDLMFRKHCALRVKSGIDENKKAFSRRAREPFAG
jgi:hypothetical protein